VKIAAWYICKFGETSQYHLRERVDSSKPEGPNEPDQTKTDKDLQ